MSLRDFLTDTSGAVTVDWVVLAASVVGLGVASAAAVRTGTLALGEDVETSLTDAGVFGLSRVFDPTDPDLSQGTANIWARSWGYDTGRNYNLHGWTRTDGNGGMVQLIRSGYNGIHSLTGGYMIDMNYDGLAALQNTVQVGDGETVFLSFNAVNPNRGNNGNGMDIYFGGQLVGSLDPGASTIQPYNFALVGGSGDGTNVVEMRPRQASEHFLSLFIDDITIR